MLTRCRVLHAFTKPTGGRYEPGADLDLTDDIFVMQMRRGLVTPLAAAERLEQVAAEARTLREAARAAVSIAEARAAEIEAEGAAEVAAIGTAAVRAANERLATSGLDKSTSVNVEARTLRAAADRLESLGRLPSSRKASK